MKIRTAGTLERRKRRVAYLFIFPSVVILTVFFSAPLIAGAFLSLFRYDGARAVFIGLYNWKYIFTEPLALKSLKATAIYTAVFVPTVTVFSLGIAVALNQGWFKGRVFFRTIYFIPVVISLIVVGLLWQWVLHPMFGLLNYALHNLGLPRLNLLGSSHTALYAVAGIAVWQGMGFYMVIFLAGLQGIPQMYYEAATIDGASKWNSFLHITLPLLSPTIAFVTIMAVITSFHAFQLIYVITMGGPADSTRVLVFHVWHTAFQRARFGYASALSMLLFLIMMVVTLIQLWYYRKRMVRF